MYTGHFGLDDGPFHGKAEGQEVYIGAQQAAVIARLRRVLAIADTAVAVSGPVGVGKTTLVRRALADLAGSKSIIPVDRMRLEPDEVLDALLSRFDVSRPPKGTIQRVAAFRRLLHERLANDTRVFIVVEDAERVGVDALLEMEALTATDSGEPVGANIVLMGASELSGLLAKPALARLRQRIRLRQPIAPFDEAEVEGYMRHCLESAGGVLEQIFEPGTARIVYRYSGGIARVIDNLCESALVAAAEAGLATILPEFLQEIAENCGLEPQVEAADTFADMTVPADIGDAAGSAVGEVEAEAEAEAGSFLSPVVPPKLALVGSRPPAAEEALAEKAGDSPEVPDSQPKPDAESGCHPPVIDETPEYAGEAEPAQPADERKPSRANVTVSRIDDELPDLIERLQLHARGEACPTADAARVAPSSDDSMEIPTLSSSMRPAVVPVRPMEEPSRNAESVAADLAGTIAEDVPEHIARGIVEDIVEDIGDDEAAAEAQEPLAADASACIDAEASEPDEASDDSTGITPALSEPGPEMGPEAKMPVDAIAEIAQVEAAAKEFAAPEEARDEPAAVEARPEKSVEHTVADAAPAAEEIAEPEPIREEPTAIERLAEVSEDRDPPAAEAAEIEPAAEAAVDDEPPVEEPADFELSLASEKGVTTPAQVAEASDDEVTTETVARSFDEDLMPAPDVATDVFAAGEKYDTVDSGEPELDALQAAIQAANAWQASETEEGVHSAAQAPEAAAVELPEITLDVELEKGKPAPNDLDRWADELSKAKSLEDISDILAETIFGNEEVEAISAEIRAKKAGEREAEAEAVPAGRPPKPRRREAQSAATKAPMRSGMSSAAAISRPQPQTPSRPAAGSGISMTMSQRIEMVNSLNGRKPLKPMPGMQVAEIVLAEQPDEPLPSRANGPQPVEAQIDTAITQSRKILSEARLARLASSDDDDDDKGKRGLFGFFRRSSKS